MSVTQDTLIRCAVPLVFVLAASGQQSSPRSSTGLIPISELGRGKYQGQEGGLYPSGENSPPKPHLTAGVAIANAIQPLGADGKPSPSGHIVFLAIGMSNTAMEFQALQKLAAIDSVVNPRLTFVDGAQGGQPAEVPADPASKFWQVVQDRLKNAGVTGNQVQVVWLKETTRKPKSPFLEEAKKLQQYLLLTVQNLRQQFPNLKITYLSSRTYGGYAKNDVSPEPYAYETGFAVKWLIGDQIAGKRELNYDSAKGPVRAPWLTWGPYIWTDGAKGRQDGLAYPPEDVIADGIHPSPSGVRKIADVMHEFFRHDAASKSWFRTKMSDWAEKHPARDSTGLIPIPDLGQSRYRGEQGGLYPGGQNTPPAKHLEAGRKIAKTITPLDLKGKASSDGRIVLLSIGMSNTTQEFSTFMRKAASDPLLNSEITLVDGAQGSQAADATADAGAPYWTVVEQRLTAAGVAAPQVQVVWLKQVTKAPFRPFPEEPKRLQEYLVRALNILAQRFPNLKIAYLSSRTYGGFGNTPLSPEPDAYESGFAMKWVIADQINGRPELNYNARSGAVRSPWLAWGPSLWTDGAKGRKDGFTYSREDVGSDGTHPSEAGRDKVAVLLLNFLHHDSTSKVWFENDQRR